MVNTKAVIFLKHCFLLILRNFHKLFTISNRSFAPAKHLNGNFLSGWLQNAAVKHIGALLTSQAHRSLLVDIWLWSRHTVLYLVFCKKFNNFLSYLSQTLLIFASCSWILRSSTGSLSSWRSRSTMPSSFNFCALCCALFSARLLFFFAALLLEESGFKKTKQRKIIQ